MTCRRCGRASLGGLVLSIAVAVACTSDKGDATRGRPGAASATATGSAGPAAPPSAAVTRRGGGSTATPILLPSDPAVGADRFERFRCARCHSVGGAAVPMGGAPDLGRLDLRTSFLNGATRMWNRVPGMSQRMAELHVPWPDLQSDDLLNLVAFITTYQYYLTSVGRAGRPDVGKRLFENKGCRGCHVAGPDGESPGPKLTGFGRGRSVMVVAQAMWNHARGMQLMTKKKEVARPAFREREMADLMAFLATGGADEEKTPPDVVTTAYVEPGSPARGAERFHALKCDHCHALHGRGGMEAKGEWSKPPDLASAELVVRDYADIAGLMWNHAVPMQARMEEEGIELPKLEHNDLADLVAFMFFTNFVDEPGDPKRGRSVFEQRGCAACHVTVRGAPSVGPNLAESGLGGARTPAAVMAAMWRAAPGMQLAMAGRNMEWPVLAGSETPDLVAFLLAVSGNDNAAPSVSGTVGSAPNGPDGGPERPSPNDVEKP